MRPGNCGRVWAGGAILLLAVVVAYLPVWHAGYIWDDDLMLTGNACIVGPLGLTEIWTTAAADICPLTLTTFWFEHQLWGLAPTPYHVVTVLMHGQGAVVLWRVLERLRIPGAWLGAALWALHPVQAESVAWITEMKNTQSGLFFLLSILFFTKWLERDKAQNRNYVVMLLFAAMAMACKSSTVVLPLLLALCAWWRNGRCNLREITALAPVFVMSLVAGAVSVWTQSLQTILANDPLPARSWAERIAMAGDNVWFYLGKLIWPHPLITIYPSSKIDAGQVSAYLPLLAVIVVLGVLWFYRTTWARPWFFAFAWFLIALLPVLGLLDNFIFHYAFVFDHFQYLASMGPLALAGAGITLLIEKLPVARTMRTIPQTILLALLAGLTWQRAAAHLNQETLWTDTLRLNPKTWMAQSNLGHFYLDRGKIDAAIAADHAALTLHPGSPETEYNLGVAMERNGKLDDAMGHYQKALQNYPNFSEAHCAVAALLLQKGKSDDAIAEYQKVLAYCPTYADAHYGLGNALAKQNRMSEAIVQFQATVQLNPSDAKAHNNLGAAYYQTAQWQKALPEFTIALQLDPKNADARTNLAKTQAHLAPTGGLK